MTANNTDSKIGKMHPFLLNKYVMFICFMACVFAKDIGYILQNAEAAITQAQQFNIYQFLGVFMYALMLSMAGIFVWLYSVHSTQKYSVIATSGFGVKQALIAFFTGTLAVGTIAQTTISPSEVHAQTHMVMPNVTDNDNKVCDGITTKHWDDIHRKPNNIWTTLATFLELVQQQQSQTQYYIGVKCNAQTCQALSQTIQDIKAYYNIELVVYQLQQKDHFFILIATTQEAEVATQKFTEIANTGLQNVHMKTITK